MKFLKGLILGVIIGAVGMLLVGKGILNKDTTPTIYVEDLKTQLEDISEFASEECNYTYSDVKYTTGSKKITILNNDVDIPFTETYYIANYSGTVKAGIDASDIDVTMEGDKILVTTGSVKVLSNALDMDTVEIKEQHNGIFNSLSAEEVTKFESQLKEQAETEAIESGLLDKAAERAENFIRTTLESMPGVSGNYTVEVTVADK